MPRVSHECLLQKAIGVADRKSQALLEESHGCYFQKKLGLLTVNHESCSYKSQECCP